MTGERVQQEPGSLVAESAARRLPAVSVVVGSNGAPGSVERCLSALEPQRDGAQVLVCEPHASDPGVRARFPWATFLALPGASVPELWREGIDRSRAPVVALTISPMIPASHWLAAIGAELEKADVVAGAIDAAPGLSGADWAEYLCRYAKDMPPFPAHDSTDLPGDNCAYRRDRLEAVRELYRDGLWEPVVNSRLAELGARLRHTPDILVHQGASAGWAAFLRQRLVHGRAHGRQRGRRFGRARNVVGVLAAPLVPPLLTQRILREVLRRRRHRLRALLAVPLVLAFNAAWALGEARGHLDCLRDA